MTIIRLSNRIRISLLASVLFISTIAYFHDLKVEFYGFESMAIDNTQQTWCSADDIANGYWVESNPITSLKELQEKYFHSHNRRLRCDADPATFGPGQTEKEAGDLRTMKMATPTFMPRGECLSRQTSWESMVKMLLRMPTGLTIIGDSIGQQLIGTFENMLLTPDGLINSASNSTWDRIIYLDKSRPETYALLKEAGVTEQRLELPLVQHWRTHHLGNETDLGAAFSHIESYVRRPYDPVEWLEMYKEHLQRMSGSSILLDETVKPEDSVMIVQTGPHWTEGELGKGMADDDAMTGFQNMVDITEARLRSLDSPVNVFWKSIASPHIDCAAATHFDNNREDISSIVDTNKPAPFNHNRMSMMNEYLYSKFLSERPPKSWWSRLGLQAPTSSEPIRLVDVWPLSVKRPEAHTVPHKNDCLHFCETGVPNEWFKLFWYMVLENAKNEDYEYRS